MKQINFSAIMMCLLATPVIALYNIWISYGYIFLFLISIGWERRPKN